MYLLGRMIDKCRNCHYSAKIDRKIDNNRCQASPI